MRLKPRALALLCMLSLGCGRSPDSYEPDDFCSQAKPLAVGETQRRSIHLKRERDWMRVQLEAGRRYRVQVRGVTGGADVLVSLFGDCNGVPLLNNGGAGRNRTFSWRAERSGPHFLVARSEKPTRYEITVTEQPGG